MCTWFSSGSMLQVPGLCKDGTGPEGYGYLGGQLVCDKDDIYGHWSPKGSTAGWMVLCREAPEGETMRWLLFRRREEFEKCSWFVCCSQ